jgi:hypothetical protein
MAFELCIWDDKKERLALLSMLSQRVAKQDAIYIAVTETHVRGHSSILATLEVER